MPNPIVEQLRRAIDAKHSQALSALATLAEYLDEPIPQTIGGTESPKKRAPREGTGKIRNAVLAAFREEYLATQTVAERTGLTLAQVRGVLSAPALKDRFSKMEVAGVMQYKFEDTNGK